MNKIVLASVTALVSMAAGCTSSGGGSSDAIIGADWTLKSVAGATLSCPPGTTTAAVYAQAVDTNYRLVGAPYIDLYNCNAGTGNSLPLPPDVYQVWVELTGDSGNNVYATSTSLNENAGTEDYPDGWFVDVLNVDKTFKTTLYADGGYFQFDWNLVDAATNAPLDCTTAAVAKVAALSTSVTNGNNAFDDRFKCTQHYGLTGALLQGAYTVGVQAVNTAGQGLGPSNMMTNKIINSPNRVTDLGSITVKVN